MTRLFCSALLSCLALVGLTDVVAAQTTPSAKPNTLVPGGTSPSGVTRLRLLAADTAPSAAATPSATAAPPVPSIPAPPLPAPGNTAPTSPPSVPTIPPGAIPPDAGDSSYPPRQPILREQKPKTSDPTVPGAAIRELLGQGDKSPQATPAQTGLPIVRLRGRVAVRDKPVTAIIEIDGRMYNVRPGDEFSVNLDGGSPTPMKVVKLTATEMQIELVARRAVINLN